MLNRIKSDKVKKQLNIFKDHPKIYYFLYLKPKERKYLPQHFKKLNYIVFNRITKKEIIIEML
jgi:hypothetical protein